MKTIELGKYWSIDTDYLGQAVIWDKGCGCCQDYKPLTKEVLEQVILEHEGILVNLRKLMDETD